MPHPRRFRFGTGACRATTRAEYLSLVREIAGLGYTVLTQPDHFSPDLSPFSALMAAADAAPTLRVGTTVFANDFRHPALLAREVATLDLLTEGRFECGLGAGYIESEYAAAGIPFDPPGVRVGRLEEAVAVIKQLWSGEPVSFAGRHYALRELRGHPAPVQRPHPPIMIAGGGKRILSLAAREADIVGLLMRSHAGALDIADGSAEATAARVAWVRAAAGARFDDLELNTLLIHVQVTEDRRRAAEELARSFGAAPELVLGSVHFLIGTVDEMVEQLQQWREQYGISYITVIPEHLHALAPVVARLAGT